MGSSWVDEKILNYNDAILRKSDLNIIRGPCYLNDRIIEFYFTYLSTNYPSQHLLLVPPSISFWIANCDFEGLTDFVEPLKLGDRELVIFTINNNADVSLAEGGTHWSLLAYYRNRNEFAHYDSMAGSNKWQAMKLYRAVKRYVGFPGSESISCFVECPTPQQTNGYDCGVYVLAIARAIYHRYNEKESRSSGGKAGQLFSALEEVDPVLVSGMRNEILSLIKDLMAKK